MTHLHTPGDGELHGLGATNQETVSSMPSRPNKHISDKDQTVPAPLISPPTRRPPPSPRIKED
ncbi:unnamed protein product, partial [Rotaria sp. Silwood2]